MIIGVILIASLVIAFFYVMYKSWNIFGFWTLIWTSVLSFISAVFLGNLVSSRVEKNEEIVYNPKEWPKFLNILVSIGIGYYLYTIISAPSISNYDYMFGMAYLILLTLLPITYAVFKLIRDRNDFISIGQESLKYKDNDEIGEFKFTDIAKVDKYSLGIKLTFKDDKKLDIKTSNMNFNGKDLLSAYNDIKAKIPIEEVKEEEK